ncbi:MAG: hypothetical protein LCH37_11510 [Bacteroidetes bacterium]|nr:hypothetical protein [Bacteroidota bacterium]
MRLATKKRIAKETLMLLSSGVITLLLFLFTYLFNWYFSNKCEGIKALINSKTILADSLSKSINSKLNQQKWFYEENTKYFDLGYNSHSDFWLRLEVINSSDSIEYKYNNIWGRNQIELLKKLGFESGKDFKDFISKNRITDFDNTKTKELKSEILALESEKRRWESKLITPDEQMKFAIGGLVIILIFLYPVRILYWITRWSIKTLKQKNQ